MAENNKMNSVQNGSCRTDCRAMMKKLRTIDFALAETNLYLDAYPDSSSALEYYGKLLCERERLAAAINASCSPLTAREHTGTTRWKWTDGPWPWQPEAN